MLIERQSLIYIKVVVSIGIFTYAKRLIHMTVVVSIGIFTDANKFAVIIELLLWYWEVNSRLSSFIVGY